MQDRLFISKNEIKHKVVLCIHFYFVRNRLLFSSPLFITLISDMIERGIVVMKLTALRSYLIDLCKNT